MPMTKWTKGDPYPKNWPEWLKKADISWCDVEIGPGMYVIWRDGLWENGTWHDGVWHDGTWTSGVWHSGVWHSGVWLEGAWRNGFWYDGTWYNGTWYDGTWYNGAWLDGLWYNGLWYDGTWKSGTWYDGTWYNGTWKSGVWKSGVWGNGTWESGHQCRPRFGWTLDPDGLIRGFDDNGLWASKTAEEWQPLLEGMSRDKVIEFEHLLLWWKAKSKTEPSGLETSIWDHLVE